MSSIYSNIENAQAQSKTKTNVGYDPTLDPLVGMPAAPARQKSSGTLKWAVFFSFLFSAVAIGFACYLYFQLQSSWEKRTQLETKVAQLSKTSETLESSSAKTLGEFDMLRRKVDEMSGKYETVQDDIHNNRFEISAIQRTVFDLQDRTAAMSETLNQIKNKVLFDPFSSSANSDVNAAASTSLPTVVSIDETTTSVTGDGPVWQTPETGYNSSNSTSETTVTYSDAQNQDLPSQRFANDASYQPAASSALSFGATPTVTFSSPTEPSVTTTSVESSTTSPVVVTTGPRVMTVNKKFNFIVINMGLKDALRMGDRLEIRRGNESIGRVEIEKLYDDFAAATIVNQKNDFEIKEGDQVVR